MTRPTQNFGGAVEGTTHAAQSQFVCVHAILYRTLTHTHSRVIRSDRHTPRVSSTATHALNAERPILSLFSQHLSRVARYLDPRLSERLDHIREPRLHNGRRALRVLE